MAAAKLVPNEAQASSDLSSLGSRSSEFAAPCKSMARLFRKEVVGTSDALFVRVVRACRFACDVKRDSGCRFAEALDIA